MISFFIPSIPRGQARPRHATINGHHRAYKSKDQERDEQTLAALMMPFSPPVALSGAISLRVTAVMPIPKSKSKKWVSDALCGVILPTGRPDLDNMCKGLLDVMQSMRFFDDDRQVCDLEIKKQYGAEPGYHIELREL
jgi:Holliday junction resolvase RusA-like endonuclease